jgi:hypothetical protein
MKKPVVDLEVDWVILGERPKKADLEKVKEKGVPIIDEQGLFDVIHDKDGMRTKRKKAEPAKDEDEVDSEKNSENKENENLAEREKGEGEPGKGKGKKAAGRKRKAKASEMGKETEKPPVKKRELRSNSKNFEACEV